LCKADGLMPCHGEPQRNRRDKWWCKKADGHRVTYRKKMA